MSTTMIRVLISGDQIQNHRDHNYHRSTSYASSLDDSDSLESCLLGSLEDNEEEFYASLTPPTPNEDIWKKFNLFPTPPRSPSHPSSDDEAAGTKVPNLSRHDDGADLLNEVTNILMDDDDMPWMTHTCHFSDPVFRAPSPISPALIQDCMWSSFIAEERRKLFLKSEKKVVGLDKSVKLPSSSLSLSSSSGPILPPLVPASEYGSSDCVDPSTVFPYPLSETRLDLFSSGTNTPSDSEEEIDVVTVEKHSLHRHRHHHQYKTHARQSSYHKQQQLSKVSLTTSTHHNQPVKISVVGNKRVRSSNATIVEIPIKKLKTEGNIEEVKQILRKSNLIGASGVCGGSSRGSSRHSSQPSSLPSSHPSSDSEDTEKRACHNVLERKRREDLRTSFLQLRDEVPELGSSERAAKVVILKKATDYLIGLREQEKALNTKVQQERRRNAHLVKQLEALLLVQPH